jgi:cellulose synthase/poly-beta-1,6-N-acetylglucosamine synthase-like glycosyltransferase
MTLEATEAPSAVLAEPVVTVVIPARDEERAIGACLDAVLAQSEPSLQVIVVDGDSRDATARIVREYMARDSRVELVTNPDGIIPRSLNLALDQARGRWFVRVDAHATIPPTYVEKIVARLATGQWGGVGGRKDGVGVTPAGRAIAAAMGSRFGVGNSTYHYGTEPGTVEHIPFGAYPVALCRALGGWDEACVVNQDFEFDWRVRQAGHELYFDPELSIDWECRQSITDLYHQYRRYGRGKANVAALHPASVRPRHLAAPALVASLGVALTLLVRRRPLAAALVVAPYAAALTTATAITSPSVDTDARPFVAPAFAAMHLGWGLGFWQGCAMVVRDRWTRRA